MFANEMFANIILMCIDFCMQTRLFAYKMFANMLDVNPPLHMLFYNA